MPPMILRERNERSMNSPLAFYLAVPVSSFYALQAVPDFKGLLDYGATACLAGYMVWLWNKHTLRWQDNQQKVDTTHREAMEKLTTSQQDLLAKLVTRYESNQEKLITALERNAEANTRMAVAIISCPHSSESSNQSS